jgi:hypothetical protein
MATWMQSDTMRKKGSVLKPLMWMSSIVERFISIELLCTRVR